MSHGKAFSATKTYKLCVAMLLWSAGFGIGVASEKEVRGEPSVVQESSDTGINLSRSLNEPAPIAELSVPPLEQFIYPDERPAWADQSGDASAIDRGETPLKFAVVSAPCSTLPAARDLRRVEVDAVLRRFAEGMAIPDSDTTNLNLDTDWIDEKLVTESYEGTVRSGDGLELFESAVLVVLDSEDALEFRRQLGAGVVKRRIGSMAAVFAVVFAGCTGATVLTSMVSRRVENRRRQVSDSNASTA